MSVEVARKWTIPPLPYDFAETCLYVNGQPVEDVRRYALRWYGDPKHPLPTLYFDGKSVVHEWRLFLAVHVHADPKGEMSGTAENPT